MKIKDIFILCTTTIILFITGCLEMEVVDQPGGVEVGSTFSSHAMVEFRKDGSIGDDDDRAMLFAVNKPSGGQLTALLMSLQNTDQVYLIILGTMLMRMRPVVLTLAGRTQ